jgi:hypothetical protein
MEWLNKLQGKIIGLDTAPLIYFIEENPTYLEVTKEGNREQGTGNR